MAYHVALDTLHNPRYAGVFCYGRRKSWIDVEGRTHIRLLPRDQWRFVKKDAHPGYLTWEEYLANQQRLIGNHQHHGGGQTRTGPAREGPALLQGLVICGRCGRNMTIRYHLREGRLSPDYYCQRECIDKAAPVCQRIPGGGIDEAIGELLVQSVTPLAMEAALSVQSEIQARLNEAARLRRQQVQRAEYEAEQARVRYMRVDPNYRLVADTLEARWNEKLRRLAEAREECEKQERQDSSELTDEQRNRIRSLATDFPRLWRDPKTPDRERKRMARLLLEDVTLRRGKDILVQVRFRGGATHEMRLPLPKCSWALRLTPPETVAEINRLLDQHTEPEIARILNEGGWRSGCGGPFGLRLVNRLRREYHLKSRQQRLREQGWLTVREMATLIGGPWTRIKYWRKAGLVTGMHHNGARDYIYRRPTDEVISKIRARQRPHYWKPASPSSRRPSRAV
jgi:hypothetical protein